MPATRLPRRDRAANRRTIAVQFGHTSSAVDSGGQHSGAAIAKAEGQQEWPALLLIEGEGELPRKWPPIARDPVQSAYPMLVTFGAVSDPNSVELVDPDTLASG